MPSRRGRTCNNFVLLTNDNRENIVSRPLVKHGVNADRFNFPTNLTQSLQPTENVSIDYHSDLDLDPIFILIRIPFSTLIRIKLLRQVLGSYKNSNSFLNLFHLSNLLDKIGKIWYRYLALPANY